jgi:hypothetical protein
MALRRLACGRRNQSLSIGGDMAAVHFIALSISCTRRILAYKSRKEMLMHRADHDTPVDAFMTAHAH